MEYTSDTEGAYTVVGGEEFLCIPLVFVRICVNVT